MIFAEKTRCRNVKKIVKPEIVWLYYCNILRLLHSVRWLGVHRFCENFRWAERYVHIRHACDVFLFRCCRRRRFLCKFTTKLQIANRSATSYFQNFSQMLMFCAYEWTQYMLVSRMKKNIHSVKPIQLHIVSYFLRPVVVFLCAVIIELNNKRNEIIEFDNVYNVYIYS